MTIPELELLDWKRRVFDLYAQVRDDSDPKQAWSRWRTVRDALFTTHPRSPIPAEERATFAGIPYFDYDPRARVLGEVTEAATEKVEIDTSGDHAYLFSRVAQVQFELNGHELELDLYWLENYGGGIFLPFRDATAGAETYGAGRYLLDTVKGADLGTTEDGRLVLDFNFAYNPSCSYDPQWVCPLAPPANRLEIEVRAGEKVRDAEGPA